MYLYFYYKITKTYIYQWCIGKLPLNAIPFYPEDTMYDYLMIENMYKGKPFIAKEWRFVNLEELTSLDEDVTIHYPESDALNMNCDVTQKPLDIYDVSWNWDMIILEKSERWKWLVINVVYDVNIDFKWFLNVCNDHYWKQWYEYISYMFKVEHKKKPNIWRDEYDSVMRMWATNDYMWYRCYIKHFK